MLAGARIFSKLDANMRFWQIPLTEDSAKLTTFITPYGRYFFKRLPFGINSAPEHFQNRMVTEVTEGLEGLVCHIGELSRSCDLRQGHQPRPRQDRGRKEDAGANDSERTKVLSRNGKPAGQVYPAAG